MLNRPAVQCAIVAFVVAVAWVVAIEMTAPGRRHAGETADPVHYVAPGLYR